MRPLLLLILGLGLASGLRADTKTLYDFESGTEGFSGKTSTSPNGATSGKQALAIDAKGMVGWQQDLAVLSNNVDWSEAVELLLDVTLPPGTKAAADYVQLIPVFSGPKNSFLQTGKVELQDGLNKVSVKLDGSQIETPWKFHLVFNSGKAIPGFIYVDHIRMRKPGKPGSLKVTVLDQAAQPVAGAIVAAGKISVKTAADGTALLKLPGDPYQAEVLSPELEPAPFTAEVPSGSSGAVTVRVRRKARPAPSPARAWIMAEKPGIAFDAHRIYGHNQAMWNGLDPFQNPAFNQQLKAIRCTMIRIPGGEYGNRWDWRTGQIKKLDKTLSVEWTPEATWPIWKKWLKDLGPQTEAFLILNTFFGTPEDQVAWIRDARESGITVRYVELGNEPDLFPERWFQGEEGASTDVAKYVKAVVPFARAIRAAFPDIKILGPTTAQVEHRECIGQSPWLCNQYDKNGELLDDPKHEDWIKKFLRLMAQEGDLIDGISVHSYPYYPKWLDKNPIDHWDAKQAFSKVAFMAKYLRLYRKWLKDYFPAKAERMDIALTEYHLQVPETWATADVESAVFIANYLAEFIKQGGTLASAWDMNTMKPADGGGHGMLEIVPGKPYLERAKYWAFKMLANNFTGSLVPAQSDNPSVAVYAAKDRGRTTVLLINQDPEKAARVTVQVSGAGVVRQLRALNLDRTRYLWSKVLSQAVLNEDPTAHQKIYGAPLERQGWRVFAPTLEPMSLNLYVLE